LSALLPFSNWSHVATAVSDNGECGWEVMVIRRRGIEREMEYGRWDEEEDDNEEVYAECPRL
jgi:hypothetical protein